MTIVQQALLDFPSVAIPLGQLAGLDIPDLRLPVPIGHEPAPAPVGVDQSAVAAAQAHVKEVTGDTPFSVVALTGADVEDLAAYVRAQLEDGSWGPWYALEASEGESPELADTADTAAGTEPIYVGETRRVQFLTATATPHDPTHDHPTPVDPASADMAPADPASVEYGPVSVEQESDRGGDGLQAVLINTGVDRDDRAGQDGVDPVGGYSAAAESFSGSPQVITRAEWGADESERCEPAYDSAIGGATVHHTAGSNDYSRAESAGILRAIYQYHVQTLDWCDIGYHALVDRYGQIFEGRAGAIDRPVRGSHAGGFNENTVGIAMMGDYSQTPPSDALVQAVGRYLGWRLDLAGLDPQGWTTMYSEGTPFTFVRGGDSIRLPTIFAHRDVGRTSCPGDAGYAALPRIRQIAADYIADKNRPPTTLTTPTPTTQTPIPPTTDSEADQLAAERTTGTASTHAELVGDLATGLLTALDGSPVVARWMQSGGEDGFLGHALTGLLSGPGGGAHADFDGGSIYSDDSGGTALVLGRILDEFRALGGELGILGAPIGDEYAVPEGRRSDFTHGSLIYDQVSRTVTRVEAPPGPADPPSSPAPPFAAESPLQPIG